MPCKESVISCAAAMLTTATFSIKHSILVVGSGAGENVSTGSHGRFQSHQTLQLCKLTCTLVQAQLHSVGLQRSVNIIVQIKKSIEESRAWCCHSNSPLKNCTGRGSSHTAGIRKYRKNSYCFQHQHGQANRVQVHDSLGFPAG